MYLSKFNGKTIVYL